MTVSSQIIEVLNDLCMKFGLAIDWSAENVLPYAQELVGKFVAWEIATSWIWIVVSLVMLAGGILVFATDIKWGWADGFMAIIGFCLIIIAVTICIKQALDIATCTHFPEKAVFDYASEYLRTH